MSSGLIYKIQSADLLAFFLFLFPAQIKENKTKQKSLQKKKKSLVKTDL